MDFVADTASDVGDGIVAAAEEVGGAVVDAGEAFVDGVGDAGGYLGDGIDWAATALDDASFGMAGWTLDLMDDAVFDQVDYLSGGLVDIDFDDGTFSAAVGIDDVFGAGMSIGEHGITAEYDTLVAGTEVGLTDDGFLAEGSAGIDFGPLPYAEGHTEVSEDGEISINGRAQATIPTPIGLVSGEVDGGFVRTDEGWGAYVNADGTLTLPTGTYVGANVGVNYAETADGSVFGASVGGRLGQTGVGEVGAGVEYDRIQQGDDVIEHVGGEVYGQGYGFEARAGADYTAGTVDGVEFEKFEAEGSLSGHGKSISGGVSYDEVTANGVTVSAWDADVDVQGFDAEELKDLGTSLLSSAAGDDVAAVLGTVTEQGRLDDFLGALDEEQTADLIGRLVGATNPVQAPVEGAVTVAGVAGGVVGDQVLGDDVLGEVAAVAGVAPFEDQGLSGGADAGTDTAGDGDAGDDEPVADEPVADEASVLADEPVAYEAPADEFETTIGAADEVEAGVEDLFEDLG